MAINEFNIHSSSKLSSIIDYEDGNKKLFQDNSIVNRINCNGQDNKNFLIHILNNSSNIADFNIWQSIFSLLLSDQNHFSD